MDWKRKPEPTSLLTGAATVYDARVRARVEAHRERLLVVKRGQMPWAEVDAWRKELHRDFERALAESKLPERPDYETANRFLVKARRSQAALHDLPHARESTIRAN